MQSEIDSRRPRPPGPRKAPSRRGGARARSRPPPQATLHVVEAKVRPPSLRQGLIARPALVNRLRREAAPVVSVVSPAGYGKTTLLAQWAAAEPRPVAWLTIDARDNDPVVLLPHVVAALDLGGGARPTADRAATALATRRPFLFVVDKADLLHAPAACRLLSRLIARAPEGSTVALAARIVPKLAAAALRTRGFVREVAVTDLALSSGEARLLLEAANRMTQP